MKKFTALAGVLLLSSSLLAACTPNAAPNVKDRVGSYSTDRGGRIMDNNRIGVRNTPYDQDRLGVRDNIGPDRGPNVLTNDARTRQDAAFRNMRTDQSLKARVESIPGIRTAHVLVAGNVAYVGINQGTALRGDGNRAGTLTRDMPPMAARDQTMHDVNRNIRGGTVTPYGDGRNIGLSGLTPQTPTTPSNYGTNIMGATDGTRNLNRAGTYTAPAQSDVSNDVKQRVVAAVKQANPSITTVYVSANPGLYNRMDAFVRDTVSGHPIRGLGDLGDMLRRMFPTTGGTGVGTAGTPGTPGPTTGGTAPGVTNVTR
ncbi:YhcN/YlaJ family sporulation lipoprotein [Tumebacillus lipolyticus]|uniref:YhcN/YlaJ family sporulation lipoprotein n=1 Tax=Tumebacillus lipolyticus TaxID=1280370 RepID=A0ABW4ZUG5_9BACL